MGGTNECLGSFYLVADEKRDDIVRAAESQSSELKKKRFGFLRPKRSRNPDPFWECIRTNTEKLEHFPYSGFLLLEIELMAPGSLESKDSLGTRLTEMTQSNVISFRPNDAAAGIKILETSDISDEAIREFLVNEGREGDISESVRPIQDSVSRLKRWLEAVSEGKTGLLMIG